jgi:hypothetical protein
MLSGRPPRVTQQAQRRIHTRFSTTGSGVLCGLEK